MRILTISDTAWWRTSISVVAACTLAVTLSACAPATTVDDGDGSSVELGDETAAAGASVDGDDTVAADDATAEGGDSTSSGSGNSGSGSGNSGSVSSGSDSSGSGSSSSGGEAGSGAGAGPSASPSPSAPPVAAVTSAITSQRCTSGKLVVTITANYDNSFRKGITSVTFERQNEFNAWLDFDGSWLGPETGQGNVWNGTLAGNQQNIGKTLRVTVVAAAGPPAITTTPITAPC